MALKFGFQILPPTKYCSQPPMSQGGRCGHLFARVAVGVCLVIGGVEIRAGAEDKAASKEVKLPQGGVIASAGQAPAVRGGAVNTFGDASLEGGGESLPVGASVQREGSHNWRVTLSNSSEDTIAISVSLVQHARNGSITKRDPISTTLGPKGSFSRTITGSPMATGCTVEVQSARVTKKAKKPESPAGEGTDQEVGMEP